MRPRFLLLITLLSGCLVTTGGDDLDPDDDLAINGLMIKTTCTAKIHCAPDHSFEWCAPLQRHSIDAADWVWMYWIEAGCPVATRGWIDCEAGGTPCSRRGLVVELD